MKEIFLVVGSAAIASIASVGITSAIMRPKETFLFLQPQERVQASMGNIECRYSNLNFSNITFVATTLRTQDDVLRAEIALREYFCGHAI